MERLQEAGAATLLQTAPANTKVSQESRAQVLDEEAGGAERGMPLSIDGVDVLAWVLFSPYFVAIVNGSVFLALTVWQSIEVEKYSTNFPSSLFTGNMVAGYSLACREIFWFLRWSIIVSSAGLIMRILRGAGLIPGASSSAANQRQGEGQQGPVCVCLGCVDVLVGLATPFIYVGGFVTVLFNINPEDCKHCHDLYQAAWWSFIGTFLILIGLCCCLCCSSTATFAAATAAE